MQILKLYGGLFMRAVITVVGKDMVGILSSVSDQCAKNQVNIIEVSQSILQEMFCMMMLVDAPCPLPRLQKNWRRWATR